MINFFSFNGSFTYLYWGRFSRVQRKIGLYDDHNVSTGLEVLFVFDRYLETLDALPEVVQHLRLDDTWSSHCSFRLAKQRNFLTGRVIGFVFGSETSGLPLESLLDCKR
ncbi:hypothetical protein ACH5RR_000731 [Cinchona calisaya]|uniref:Uncharacterized protein n=1 Tax=Cinchona calisaya TaxID=153742 RepID=A0ABD3B1Z3_9GENT